MKDRIYLDHAATTPVSPEVLEAMTECMHDVWGNASGVYGTGRDSRRAIDRARRQVADALGAQAKEIYFTGGGSESDNWAIKGTAFAMKAKGNHIITTAIEHHAVLHTCEWLEKNGFRITYLQPDSEGFIHPAAVENAVTEETVLISVMSANNEIGTLEPVAEIGKIAHKRGIVFHTDAVQAFGAIPINVNQIQADLLSLSAHKLYGPKGIGALYIREGTRIEPLIHGGAQERGLRAGTENVAGAVGLGTAVAAAIKTREADERKIRFLRDRLIKGILERIPDAYLNGSKEKRLPNNCHFSFRGIESESLLLRLDLVGIAASGGSACTSGAPDASHVLRAIGLPDDKSQGSIRMTVGKENTEEEIDEVLRILPDIVKDLRDMRRTTGGKE